MVRTASVVLIIFLAVTLFLFASLRIYDHGRVIQMNMEIALILAHITLLIPDMYNVSDLVFPSKLEKLGGKKYLLICRFARFKAS